MPSHEDTILKAVRDPDRARRNLAALAAHLGASAAELLGDLQQVARDIPFSVDAWERLLKHVADNAPDATGLKKAG